MPDNVEMNVWPRRRRNRDSAAPSGRTQNVLRASPSASRRRSTLAYVTSLAAFAVAASAILDVVTTDPQQPLRPFSWIWITAALLIAAAPAVLGRRFPWQIALVGCWLLVIVTGLQVYFSTQGIVAVNNLVLYPLLACYMGWFFRHWCARATVAAAFIASGIGLLINPFGDALWITWINLLFVSVFSLEATIHLRRVSNRRIETDPLTGILNRAGYYRTAAEALAAAQRAGTHLTLVLIDIDDFKRVNDTRGHAAGDHTLITLAATVRAAIRRTDHIARIGGDEFVVLLPGMSTDNALGLIERLHRAADYTFSYGIAQSVPGESTDTLLARADAELYLQKTSRQNRPDPDPV
ncbi:hypothetical protein CH263_20255 [Rhodococcus sp. 06-1059B-a]|nr:GGDEF domain-containing protein [Rhodococcus sp. 06-1059B-a]OZD60825.1 hypothetical protein CH263_20255 [Rhodococcus sp. 06-1059B-a]